MNADREVFYLRSSAFIRGSIPPCVSAVSPRGRRFHGCSVLDQCADAVASRRFGGGGRGGGGVPAAGVARGGAARQAPLPRGVGPAAAQRSLQRLPGVPARGRAG